MPKMTEAPKKKKTEPIPTEEKVVCMNCGCKNQGNFYQSQNPFNKYYKKIPYCKDCVKGEMWNYYLKKYNNNEQLALHSLLRFLNLPYIHSIYTGSVKNLNNPNSKIKFTESDEDSNDNSALISAYMKNYNSMFERNGYGSSYEDSQGLGEIRGLSEYEDIIKIRRRQKAFDGSEKVDATKYDVIEYDADYLVAKWGDFDDEDLVFLENEYLDWKDKIGEYINEKSTDLMVKLVCSQTLEVFKKRQLGEKVKDEVSTLQSLLNNSGLLEKQEKNKLEDKKIGTTIAEIERFRPIEKPRAELVDVDNYGEIIDTFLGGMSRSLGKTNEFTERFDKLYRDYSIDMEYDNFRSDDNGSES